MQPSQRVIKKYPNRRLYDTELKAYITLEDIKKLVFAEAEFQVIDAKTKKDITQSTLLQIIADQEATGRPIFSTHLLKYFIRFHPEKSNQPLSQYLEQAMNFFSQQREFFETQWKSYQQFVDPLFLQNVMNFKNKFKKPPSSEK